MKQGLLKKIAAGLMVVGIAAYAMANLTACNIPLKTSGAEYRYVVTEENGENVLHEVECVKGYEDNDTLHLETECCKNSIGTSSNKAVLYKNKPEEKAYDRVCEHCAE